MLDAKTTSSQGPTDPGQIIDASPCWGLACSLDSAHGNIGDTQKMGGRMVEMTIDARCYNYMLDGFDWGWSDGMEKLIVRSTKVDVD